MHVDSPADGHDKLFTLCGPVDSGKGPCDTDAEEDVDGVGASDVTYGSVGGVVLNSSDLASEGVYNHGEKKRQ